MHADSAGFTFLAVAMMSPCALGSWKCAMAITLSVKLTLMGFHTTSDFYYFFTSTFDPTTVGSEKLEYNFKPTEIGNLHILCGSPR